MTDESVADILVASDLSESDMTVADAVLVDGGAFVDTDARRDGDRTLSEFADSR